MLYIIYCLYGCPPNRRREAVNAAATDCLPGWVMTDERCRAARGGVDS